jgi:hypothetical protein
MSSEISSGSHYYLKDLKWMYYVCRGLCLYGLEDQTLLIDDEPNKAFQNPKWIYFFSWIIQGIDVVKEQGALVGPCILFVAALAWIAVGQYGWSSLWLCGQIF